MAGCWLGLLADMTATRKRMGSQAIIVVPGTPPFVRGTYVGQVSLMRRAEYESLARRSFVGPRGWLGWQAVRHSHRSQTLKDRRRGIHGFPEQPRLGFSA